MASGRLSASRAGIAFKREADIHLMNLAGSEVENISDPTQLVSGLLDYVRWD